MGSLRSFYEGVDRSSPCGAHRVDVELRLLESVAGDRRVSILDLGCGDGAIADLVGSRFPEADVVALDWSRQALVGVRQRGLRGVLGGIDGPVLPLRTGAFDVVLLSEVLEHLVDPDAALDEVRRVLVPGGTLLLSTPNLAAWFNRVLLAFGVQPVFSEVSTRGVYGRPGSTVVGHLRLFTARALTGLLRDRGFVDVELSGASYHDVPRAARGLDRLAARLPPVAAILVGRARAAP
ncbi:MAG: class I SAM-dependent methyltransferase [Acidimicrobiales bacterium]